MDDKWPITRLGQEKFSRGLVQRPLLQRIRLHKPSCQLRHAILRDAQMPINPFRCFIQPNAPVAFFTPTRRRRFGELVGGMAAQILRRRYERERLLVVVGFANEEIQKLRPFVPPMSKQLRSEERLNSSQ